MTARHHLAEFLFYMAITFVGVTLTIAILYVVFYLGRILSEKISKAFF